MNEFLTSTTHYFHNNNTLNGKEAFYNALVYLQPSIFSYQNKTCYQASHPDFASANNYISSRVYIDPSGPLHNLSKVQLPLLHSVESLTLNTLS